MGLRHGIAGAWLVVVVLGLAAVSAPAAAGQKLSPERAYALAKAGKILLFDIRSPEEWRRSGVPAGAKTVTMHDAKGPRGFYEAILAAVGGDKTRPIALICAAGNRSRWAQSFLVANGFLRVLDVSEGVFGNGTGPGWLRRGLPMRPCGDCRPER